MLAQNFKSAADLGITEPQLSALQKTLVLLETGKLRHITDDDAKIRVRNSWREAGVEPRFDGNFNLSTWGMEASCGTVACIGGTAEAITGVSFDGWMDRPGSGLNNLFAPNEISTELWSAVTPAQAATALRSYLTTGDAKWHEAVA